MEDPQIEGRAKLDDPQRGGRDKSDDPLVGGAKHFGLGLYFFKFLKPIFLCFWGVLGTFEDVLGH